MAAGVRGYADGDDFALPIVARVILQAPDDDAPATLPPSPERPHRSRPTRQHVRVRYLR
jgi:hypothetical protein